MRNVFRYRGQWGDGDQGSYGCCHGCGDGSGEGIIQLGCPAVPAEFCLRGYGFSTFRTEWHTDHYRS
jgi:hypothetical protein